MEQFTQLFGRLLALVYHCFDRIVILGHLPLLTRPENIVHFFRDVHGVRAITKEVLRQRTDDYHRWVETFARNHQIPIEWAEKGVRKEDYVLPFLQRMERRHRFGVYFIFKSMEQGSAFRSAVPKYPTADPDYRILSRQRCRYTHYYFYIRDEVLGPVALCVGSFLPFAITYYLNGHNVIERELRRAGVEFRKNDNAFLWVADRQALQAAADRLSPDHPQALGLLDLGGRPEVFRQGPPGHQPGPPLLAPTGRVLPQCHLPAPLPHPHAVRALL